MITNKKNRTISLVSRVPEAGSVRIGPLMAVPALLDRYAEEPAEDILAQCGVELALFNDPENSISFNRAARLLEVCVDRTGIQHFGLLVGQQVDLAALGNLGKLGLHAPNVGSALYSMIVHLCMNDRGGVATLSVNKGQAKLGYAIYVPVQHRLRHIYSISISVICNLMRSMCGRNWTPTEVLSSNTQPKDIRPYKDFFGAPLDFQASEDALLFPEHWLHQPLPDADKQKHDMIVNELNRIEINIGNNLLEEMRSVIRPLVISNSCQLENVARMLSMHPRTLNRRLKEHGTSYRELVGTIRYEIAQQLLTDKDLPIINISNTLGYADASEFTRAFRRWSEVTPSEWRMQNNKKFHDSGQNP
jgi:AraC-like DNA-binding protein